MDSIVEAKVKDYLRNGLHCDAYDCGAIVAKMRSLARMAGHHLGAKFAHAGLGAGPEARIAASIVDRALGGGGSATAEHAIRHMIEKWTRSSPPTGG
jgi:hypothetical protein